MSKLLMAALAASAALMAAPASAATYLVQISIDAGDWMQVEGSTGPFGASSDPSIFGSFTADDATVTGGTSGAESVSGLALTIGTRTFTEADLTASTQLVWLGGLPGQVQLDFGNLNFVLAVAAAPGQGNAGFNDGDNRIACNTCGSMAVPGVPEPATWALMIAGFGLAGTSLRRRRSVAQAG